MKGSDGDPVDLVAVAADDELITRLSAGAVLDPSVDPLVRLMAEWVAETRRGELGSCRCGHSPDAHGALPGSGTECIFCATPVCPAFRARRALVAPLQRSEPVGRGAWWIIRWARRRRGKRSA